MAEQEECSKSDFLQKQTGPVSGKKCLPRMSLKFRNKNSILPPFIFVCVWGLG